jgi:hypothetical protein
MHPLMRDWHARWKVLNPDWDVFLWEDDPADKLVLRREGDRIVLPTSLADLMERACHLSQRSNIWRYELIRRLGGLYADTDVEPLRPLNGLLDSRGACVAQRHAPYTWFECAFFGAEPDHPWTGELVARLRERDPAVTLSMGTEYFTQTTLRHPEVALLPKQRVLSQPPGNWEVYKRAAKVPSSPEDNGTAGPETVAKHHWSSSWYPTGFVPVR